MWPRVSEIACVTSCGGDFSGVPVTMYQQMLMECAPAQAQQHRPVRVVELDTLKEAVDANPALKWDERMADMAGAKAVLLCDDVSDDTSQVRFEQLSIIAWLPTCAISDLKE